MISSFLLAGFGLIPACRDAQASGTITRVADGEGGVLHYDDPAVRRAFSTKHNLFFRIGSIAVDEAGDLLLPMGNKPYVIRASPDGRIAAVAGSGAFGGGEGDGGPALEAPLYMPHHVTVDAAGGVLFTDDGIHRVRRITPDGRIESVTGDASAEPIRDGVPARNVSLPGPAGLAIDRHGNLFVADAVAHRIVRVDPKGILTVMAGTGEAGFSGDGGPARKARLDTPTGLTVDSRDTLYVIDRQNRRVRAIDSNGTIRTIAGGGDLDPVDGLPATAITLFNPGGIAVDSDGRLFVSASVIDRVIRVDANETVTVIAGGGSSPLNDIPALEAYLYDPRALAIDRHGSLFIEENGANRVRKVIDAAAPGLLAGRPFPPLPPPGDATGDGAVDLRDVTRALRFAVGATAPTPRERIAADVSPLFRDGRVTLADAMVLLRVVTGLSRPSDLTPTLTVRLAPIDTEMLPGQSLEFPVRVTGAASLAVTYRVNGIPWGGGDTGWINEFGGYVATGSPPGDPFVVRISVESRIDPAASDSIDVTVRSAIGKYVRLVAHHPLGGSGRNSTVRVYGHHAYIGSWERSGMQGIRVVDISVPSAPRLVGRVPIDRDGAFYEDLAILRLDSSAYAGDVLIGGAMDWETEKTGIETIGLRLFDVSRPEEPVFLSAVTAPFEKSGVHSLFAYRRGDRAYVAAAEQDRNVHLFDITNPRRPQWVSSLYRPGGALYEGPLGVWVTADGLRAYVARMDRTLDIFDLTDPARPYRLDDFDTGLSPGVGHTAIPLPGGTRLLYGVEWIDAVHPQSDGSTEGRMGILQLAGVNGPAIEGVYTILDPRLAHRSGWYSAHDVDVKGNLAFVAAYSAGVRVIDLSDPSNPREVGSYLPPPLPDPKVGQGPIELPKTPLVWGIQRHTDGYLYASDINGGLYILEYTGPVPPADVDGS